MQLKFSWLKSVALFCAVFFFSSCSSFVLVKDGQAEAVIVKNAAVHGSIEFFNAEAVKSTGVSFPLVDAPLPGKNNIMFELADADLENDDAYSIEFPEPGLMRVNCSKRSARWAVNHLLQENFGQRWLLPDLPKIYDGEINEYPQLENVLLPRKKIEQKPYSFWLYRSLDWHSWNWTPRLDMKHPFVGSHFLLVDVFPVWKYAPQQSWPEEMLPILKGKKYVPPKPSQELSKNPHLAIRGYNAFWNPCFSHPKTCEIAVENILEILRDNPDKLEIDMGLNDNGGICECESCQQGIGGRRNSGNYIDYSEVFWRWVNNVAEKVCEKHPKLYFVALAYREVMDPPSFKLHPNVVIRPCFELAAMNQPEIYAKRRALLRQWSEKASLIAHYDYGYGLGNFLLPRIYFASHSKFLKELYHEFGVRGLYVESRMETPFEGPKHFLIYSLLKDIEANPEAIVWQWCVDAVGEKAAPFLRRYYQFWEDYWVSDAIKQTVWYKSHTSIYMQLGERSSHLFALQPGDMAGLRLLMQNVLDKAESPSQARRAQALFDAFEISELASQALLAEPISPDGSLSGLPAALALCRQIPAAFDAIEKIGKNRFAGFLNDSKADFTANLMGNLGALLPYTANPQLQAELAQLSENEALPQVCRGQFKVWLGAKAANLIENGSFEEEAPLPSGWGGQQLSGRRSQGQASDGNYAISGRNPFLELRVPVIPGKTYLVLFDALAEKTSAEGRFNYLLSPSIGKTPYNHLKFSEQVLAAGRWQGYSAAALISNEKGDNLRIHIWGSKYEPDEIIHIDNLRCYCLDDLEL